jgi:PST family polysaccharide transporter
LSFREKMQGKKGVLLKNTIMLYILQFSTYLLAFIVVPYETRVLGPTVYGKLGVATAIMVYFQLVIDFGFILSATEDVSRNREDNAFLRNIFTSVTVAKLFLTAGSLLVLMVLCRAVRSWQGNTLFFTLFFAATAINSMMPDYLYRGLEDMTAITVRTVLIKLFFTCMIFVLLKTPEQLCVIPALNIVGNLAALIGVYMHLNKKYNVRFVKPDMSGVGEALRRSSKFFYSRIATTAYTAANTIIIDLLTKGGSTVGYYTSADKLITTGKSAMSPISDSLYPYMVKNRDFKLVKKVLLIAEPIIAVFCVAVFIFAKPLCLWFFGAEYGPVAPILRAMLPVGIVILPSYILGFPTLTAMGLSKHANYSVIFGSCLHVVNLLVLYFTGHMNEVTLGALISIAETAILAYRVIVIARHRDLLKNPPEEEAA